MNVETVELQAVAEVAKTDEAIEVLALSLDDLDLVAGGTSLGAALLTNDIEGDTGRGNLPISTGACAQGLHNRTNQFPHLHTAPTGAVFLPAASRP